MPGSTLLDPECLAALVESANRETVGGLVVALAGEISTLRRAFTSLLGVIETRHPASREVVLQDLHEALQKEKEPPNGIERSQERVDALNYFIDAVEMNLRPDQT